MRTYSGPQDTVLTGGSYRVSARALVANADGVMIDLTTVGGINWFDKIDLDMTIDQVVSQATLTLRRGAGPTLSLSPLRSDSTVNVNGVGAYAPLIDLGRKIQIDVATTALGVAPVTADWQAMFLGYIDAIDFGSDPISVTARDLGAVLVDTWIEADASYGTGPGRAIELVMQDILDAVFGAGVVPLYTPTSPGFLITSFTQKSMGVMAALTALAGTIGWDTRYAWDAGTSQFRLTLSQPPRTSTTPIYTFGPSRYINVTKLALDRTNIRNAIGVDYPIFDIISGAEARAQIPTAIDTTSVAKFGRRYMGITEPSGSPINTQTKAQNLAAAALADLKSPPAEQEIELHLDWRVELHDLDTFSANSVHYNADQKWAVAGVRHTLEPTKHRTRITARGAPAGNYLSWIGRGPNGSPVGKPVPPIAKITPGSNAGSSQLDLTFDATPGVGGSTLLDFKITIKKGGTSTMVLDSVINTLSLPYMNTFTRDPQMVLVAMFVVTDRTTGLSSAPAFYAIESSRNYINSSGQPLRTQQWSDGGYGFKATNTTGYAMDSNAIDSRSAFVNGMFRTSVDTADNLLDGTASPIAGGRLGFSSLDATGLLGSKLVRSRGFSDGNTAAVTTDAFGYKLHASSIDSSSRVVNAMFNKPIDTADVITDGATSPLAGGRLGYSSLDATGLLGSKNIRSRGHSDGYFSTMSATAGGLDVASGVTDAYTGNYIRTGFFIPANNADQISDGATSPLAGGRRGFNALNSSYRITDETHLPMVRVNSGGATPFYGAGNSTNPISSVVWNAGSSTYTANIAAFTVYAGSKTISYNSGSIAGLFQNITYYLYCDDPNFAGGSPGYFASQVLHAPTDNDGRVYVGAVTTGSGGAGSTSYSGGSAACFEGDTLIAMADGSDKRISAIEAGDTVVSFDPSTGELGDKCVSAVKVHDVREVLVVETELARIVTTPEHPFYLEGGTFGAAGWLRKGNYVMRCSFVGRLHAERVVSVQPTARATKVYNFEVEDWHTYIANGFAVHNVKLI